MAKYTFLTVIAIDPADSVVHFYSMNAGDRSSLTHDIKRYRAKLFDKEFFTGLGSFMEEYGLQYPSSQAAGVTVVLPDSCVCTDVLSVPTMRWGKSEEALKTALNSLYRNRNELKLSYFVTTQNKQFTTYQTMAVRSEILTNLYATCATNKMSPRVVTFAGNAMIDGIMSLNSKMRSGSYLVMDIRAHYTRVVSVVKGKTAACFELPFGVNALRKTSLAAEDLLLDQPVAEMIVAEARERAKNKQSGMAKNDNVTQIAQQLADEETENAEGEEQTTVAEAQPEEETAEEDYGMEEEPVFAEAGNPGTSNMRAVAKKQARRLPKFMLRPQPHSQEEYICENFRLFTKWALNLVDANNKDAEAVYVNIPAEFNFVFESTKDEEKENGRPILPLDLKGETEAVTGSLELYGGFFADSYNKEMNL